MVMQFDENTGANDDTEIKLNPEEDPPKQDAEWDSEEIAIEKTLHNSDISGTRVNVPDVQVVGDGDTFKLICKASSQAEGWMKSTKAMATPQGCVVQVTTQQKNPDGSYVVAEALTYVPGVKISKSGGLHTLTKL